MAIDIDQEVREIEKELREEDARGEGSKDRQLWRNVSAVFLIFLFASYFLIDPTVRGVIVGFFESSDVEDNSFIYQDKIVTFEGEFYQELVKIFRVNQKQEVRVCLQGNVQGNQHYVTGIVFPKVYSSHVFRVISGPCPEETIIDLHTHPYQHCVASEQDLKTLAIGKERNPDLLMGVMCTEERISFYG